MKSMRTTVLLALAACAAAQTIPPGGSVQGTVINSATGAGIEAVSVVLSASRSGRYETTSDTTGHFKLTGMAAGSYVATAEKDGFATPPLDTGFLSYAGLRVGPGIDPVNIEFKLAPLNTIVGRVMGTDGKPAAGVEVSLSPNITANFPVTDQEGRFMFEEIRPGSYTLMARPPANAQPEEGKDGSRTAMVPTYYPSVVDQALAQKILSPGAASYEIRMQTAPVHRVRGVVMDEEGNPLPGAQLILFPIADGMPEPRGLVISARGLSVFVLGMQPGVPRFPEATAISQKDGHFEFPAVRAGDWRIDAVFYAPLDAPAAPSRGTVRALVGQGDVDVPQVHLAKPFKLTGTMEWKGEDPGSQTRPPFLSGGVMLMNQDDTQPIHLGRLESGRLLFDDILPGRYELMVRPGLVARLFLGAAEVNGTFSLTPNGPPPHLVLKTWVGSVRGTVEHGDGATVVLIPQRIEGVGLGQAISCGAGGSFELSEVSPGDYYIAAFDHMDGFVPSMALLSLVPSRGTSVKVEERSVANVTLSMSAAPR